jgi:hypothetical protein
MLDSCLFLVAFFSLSALPHCAFIFDIFALVPFSIFCCFAQYHTILNFSLGDPARTGTRKRQERRGRSLFHAGHDSCTSRHASSIEQQWQKNQIWGIFELVSMWIGTGTYRCYVGPEKSVNDSCVVSPEVALDKVRGVNFNN